MHIMRSFVVGLVVVLIATVAAAEKVTIRDDCDRTDLTWAQVGGCTLREGNVTRAEFGALLQSTLPPGILIGHPAWRNDPPYVTIEPGETVRVTNKGGRAHTFTEVAAFGGGNMFNFGLTPAPECATAQTLLPGASVKVSGLSVGNHHFLCCFHPWMRALIKVIDE